MVIDVEYLPTHPSTVLLFQSHFKKAIVVEKQAVLFENHADA